MRPKVIAPLPIRLTPVICLCLLLWGCSASRLDLSLKDQSHRVDLDLPPIACTIAVDNFLDMRPQTRGSDNKKWMGFIPGILWVDIETDMPEIYTAYSPFASRDFNFNAAQAVADHLNRSAIAKKVIFLPEDPYAYADYRLEGIVRLSRVKERGYYYGSSIYAWITRILAFPYVSYSISLEIMLRLRDLSNDKIIWQQCIEGRREDRYHSVYALARGKEGKHLIAYNFSKIIDQSMDGLIPEIRQAVIEASGGACGR